MILNVIEKGREQVSREILERAAERTADLGIELLDLRIKRINYVEEVQQDVFARMIAERQRIAELYRSEGQGEAARIQGERERELQRIQSEAFKTAEELRGKADAEATDVYAAAYGRDADFYAFTRSLETYEAMMDPAHDGHPGHRQRVPAVSEAAALDLPSRALPASGEGAGGSPPAMMHPRRARVHRGFTRRPSGAALDLVGRNQFENHAGAADDKAALAGPQQMLANQGLHPHLRTNHGAVGPE